MRIASLSPQLWQLDMEENGWRQGKTLTAWMITGQQGVTVIGTLPGQEWLAAIRPHCAGKPCALVALWPDAAAVAAFLEAFPGSRIIGNTNTLFALRETLGEFTATEIRSGRKLSLFGRCLVFRPTFTKSGAWLQVIDLESGRVFGDAPQPPKKPQCVQLAVCHAGLPALAAQIVQGARESGLTEISVFDLTVTPRQTVLDALPGAQSFLFGTPDCDGEAAYEIWDILISMKKLDCRGKLAGVFYETQSGESTVDSLRRRMEDLGFDGNLQSFFWQGIPTQQVMKNAAEYGFAVGCSVQRIPNPRKPKLVKCLVCGEIFDASLGACPVCGVGLEQCVSVEDDAPVFRNDTDRTYLIVGGGVAAVSAAEAIRLRDGTGKIVMLSAEPELPINRPMLTKDLELVCAAPESLSIHPETWYAEKNIELHLGCRVTAIDPVGKTAAADTVYPYDKLIYAAGAECFIPPFAGWQKEGVLTIRHLADSQKMAGYMENAKKCVVIGGGVLGLEAASELMRFGLSVTVLEATPQIIGRQADALTAARIKEIMAKMHVACYEGVSIAAIEGDTAATGVRLDDGRIFPADFVVVSCGNRANIAAAETAGCQAQRSIVVNHRMETTVKDIYACGDCCQLDGVNYQLWQEASNQGRVAGANAAGDNVSFSNQMLGLSLEGFGASLFAMGDPGKRTDIPYRKVELSDELRDRHETYWYYGGSLQGAVAINAPEKTASITRAVTEHARYEALECET